MTSVVRSRLGTLLGAALAVPLGLYLAAPSSDRPTHGDRFIGRAGSIPVGGAHHRLIDGEEYIVIRRGEDDYLALSATCTHSRICLVEWDRERRQLVCPCHRGIFDLQVNVVSGPPPRPLVQRPVVVRDGSLYARPVSS